MASTYIAKQGDTFDLIAYKQMGSEQYMQALVEANWPLLDTLVFSGGEVLTIPDIPEESIEDLPFWRSDDEDEEDEESYSQVEEVDEDE